MQANDTHVEADDRDEARRRMVLYMLCGIDSGPPLWTVEDLARELESADAADVAVTELLRGGLAYRTADGFVFASRAATVAVETIGYVL